METVELYARPDWLPHKQLPEPNPLPLQMHYTKWLIATLREVLPRVINPIDGSSLQTTDVTVLPDVLHPWCLPDDCDIRLVVYVQDREKGLLNSQERRARIHQDLSEALRQRMTTTWLGTTPQPRLQLEVRPHTSTGSVMDLDGKVTASWETHHYRVERCRQCNAPLDDWNRQVSTLCPECTGGG